jgi:hypothetical protein
MEERQAAQGQGDTGRGGETQAPHNPPNSVTRPAVRTVALTTYLGGVVVVFVIATAIFAYWSLRPGGERDAEGRGSAQVGTAGERLPGGFDPAPRPGSTAEELQFRGAGEPPQGPTQGLSGPSILRSVTQVVEDRPAAGTRVELRGVVVDVVDGQSIQIRDDDRRLEVVLPPGSASLSKGQRVDIDGVIESQGAQVRRLRAVRLNVTP